jgi:branched-chain amino acid transport system permease protein
MTAIVARLAAPGPLAVALLLLAAAVAAAGNHYLVQVTITALLFVMFAVSLNLVTGTAGLLSLGHMAMAGLGAYASSLLALHLAWPLWLTIPLAGVAVAVLGTLLTLPSLRLVSIHFAVSTLAVAEIVLTVITNWVDLTRGPMGLRSIPRLSLGGIEGPPLNLVVVGVACAAAVFVVARIVRSEFGDALRAVREDELSAEAMGLDAGRLKVRALAVSGFVAGIGGALLAHTTGFISPESFRFGESVLVLAMVVLGGLGSVPGAVLGALLLIGLPELLRDAGHLRMLLVGVVLFGSILFLPQGLLGETRLMHLLRRRPREGTSGAAAPAGAEDLR